MTTIQAELETATLGPEYSYLVDPQPVLGRIIKRAFDFYCRMLFTLYCPLTVKGKENIPNGSFLFCSNHNSHMDSAVLMTAAGTGFRSFGLIAAKDYFFDNPQRKYFLNLLMNLIPIDRKSGSNRQAMIEYLLACKEFARKGGRSLIIYPEGTRSRTGEMGKFKKGPAMISAEVGLPIVPAFITGSFASWPKGRFLMRPGRVSVTIGKPIYPEEHIRSGGGKDGAHFRAYRTITDELEQSIHTLKNGSADEQER